MHFIKNSTKLVEFLSDSDKALGKINPEFVDWEQQDQLLLSWLLSSMSENLLTRMIGCDESSKIWSKLEQYFTVTMKTRIKQLRSQLSATTKANLSMDDYLLKIKNIVDLLGSIGEEISASTHIDAIFEGLTSEYDSFVTSVETRMEPYSVSEVEALLLAQERRVAKHNNNLDSNKHSANIATMHSAQHRSQTQSTQVQQFPGGNNTRDGYRGGRSQSRGRGRGFSNSSNRPQCQVCGRLGHLAMCCWYRFDQNFTGNVQDFSQTPGAGRGI